MGKIFLNNVNTDKKVGINVDDMTSNYVVTSQAHHQIHAGLSFKADLNTDDLDSNPLAITFKTPNTEKWFHLFILANSSGEAQMEIMEPQTVANDGTLLSIINRNRNSSNESSAISTNDDTPNKVTQGATVTLGTGVLLHHERFGSGKNKISGESRDVQEFILKQNTVYAITMTSGTNSIIAQLTLNWYEHTSDN